MTEKEEGCTQSNGVDSSTCPKERISSIHLQASNQPPGSIPTPAKTTEQDLKITALKMPYCPKFPVSHEEKQATTKQYPNPSKNHRAKLQTQPPTPSIKQIHQNSISNNRTITHLLLPLIKSPPLTAKDLRPPPPLTTPIPLPDPLKSTFLLIHVPQFLAYKPKDLPGQFVGLWSMFIRWRLIFCQNVDLQGSKWCWSWD